MKEKTVTNTTKKPKNTAKQQVAKASKGGYVYLMSAIGTDRYKIGFIRKHPSIRQKQLNGQQNAYEIALVIYCWCEQFTEFEGYLKSKYLAHRVRGEWFVFSSSVLKQVLNDIVTGYPLTISVKKNDTKLDTINKRTTTVTRKKTIKPTKKL